MSRNTDFEKPEEILSEMSLIDSIRLTDTVEAFDTLTITSSLVDDPNKFYQIGEKLVGTNFMKIPYK